MIPENCTFCGLCCTLTVRLSERDIKRIEKGSGRKREDFVVADNDGKPLLKREKGWCTFFKREGRVGICTIYDSRPDNCRDFPGKRLCDLAENPLYRHLSDNNENKRVRLLLKNAPTSATPAKAIEEAQQNAAETFKAISEK
ncbi:YkgJ family cysteine cluster protein [Candidatus Woesearchaeota archaeon]|nr:YkgJ family cysteine cluster protein [Candidatus Woesearchaeota archaeon]